jgi:hypothetical protein
MSAAFVYVCCEIEEAIHEPGIEHAFGADFRGLFVIPVNDG